MTNLIDDDVDAWAYRTTAAQRLRGPLSGVPFGIKDIIDVRGMPTAYGLDDFPPRIATIDASCVAALRAAGAVPVGKTRSTALASRDQASTINPRAPHLTPGGSSAGSAAAVAAGHVPFALGTQTLGSVVRPAAFCGVVGFKPTYGSIPLNGVAPLAPSFDTVGWIARDVAIAKRVADVLLHASADEGSGDLVKLGYVADVLPGRFQSSVLTGVGQHVRALDDRAFAVEEMSITEGETMAAAIETIMAFEAHSALAPFAEICKLPPGIAALISRGAAISYVNYRSAQQQRRSVAGLLLRALAVFDALIVAIADDAPDRDSTGDGIPQAIWTACGAPTISVPCGTSPSGSPISVGIVAAPGRDFALLDIAQRIEQSMARAPS